MIPITRWIDVSVAPCGGFPSYGLRYHGLAPVATPKRPTGFPAKMPTLP